MSETVEKEIKTLFSNIHEMAKKLDLPYKLVLTLLSHRELLIINQQLRQLHEMFDLIYAEKKPHKEAEK